MFSVWYWQINIYCGKKFVRKQVFAENKVRMLSDNGAKFGEFTCANWKMFVNFANLISSK